MLLRNTCLRFVHITLSVFLFSGLVLAQKQDIPAPDARINPNAPIEGIKYSLEDKGKFLVVTVALRELPKTAPADQGILATSFKMGALRSAAEDKSVNPEPTSTSLKAIYKVEVNNTPRSVEIRLGEKWTEFNFFVQASFRKPDDATDTQYESPKFTIVRNIQLPTIAIGTPKWQAERPPNSNTTTKYLAVPITPSVPMKVNVVVTDGINTFAQKNNFLVGGGETTDAVLSSITDKIISAGTPYKIKVTSVDDTNAVTVESDWKPVAFIQNYRLADNDQIALSAYPPIETDQVRITVNTRAPGKSLRLLADDLVPTKIRTISNNDTQWTFEVDLTGVTQKTVPFYFDGEGQDGQVFDGKDKRYFFNLNNDLKVVGALTVSFNSQHEMVVNYKLNRKADDHRLRLELPTILELKNLPQPVRVSETNEYNVTAKTEVAALLTELASKLKSDNSRTFPVKFKLIPSDAASGKPFAEFAIHAYGVTTGSYLKKIADISELVGTSEQYKDQNSARVAVLGKLGLQALPTSVEERNTVESLVTLLTMKDRDARRKNFWTQLGSYALKILPVVIGIPVGL